MNYASRNSELALKNHIAQSHSDKENLSQLSKALNITKKIKRVEAYDNSHLSGKNAVGAMIVYSEEGFEKKSYRKFNIDSSKVKLGDDYGMMKEVLFRRFSKAIKEKSGSLSLPDLIMIDGGKGQYSVSREVLNELGLHDLPILAVAKGKRRNAGEEKIYYKNKEYILMVVCLLIRRIPVVYYEFQ